MAAKLVSCSASSLVPSFFSPFQPRSSFQFRSSRHQPFHLHRYPSMHLKTDKISSLHISFRDQNPREISQKRAYLPLATSEEQFQYTDQPPDDPETVSHQIGPEATPRDSSSPIQYKGNDGKSGFISFYNRRNKTEDIIVPLEVKNEVKSTWGRKKMESKPNPRRPSNTVLPYQTPRLRDHYLLGKKLGQGQFRTTYLCTEKSTSANYACKSIPKRKLVCREDYEDVWCEIQIMHHLSEHPNVVRIKGTYEDSVFVHIVMEVCEGGELFDRIVSKGHFSEREAVKLIKTILGVVEACHSLGVMHRDLKPENFLFDSPKEDAKLKATDFGLSVFYKPGQYLYDVVGSPYYVAPEVLKKCYGPEIDVWSAGVILYILLSGVPPFWAETESGIFRQILQGKLDFKSDPWPSISEAAKDLIYKMLERSPKKRISAHEALCHPWIVDEQAAPDKPLDPAVLSRLKQFSQMNKIKKMALRVIAERLSEEEIGGLKELFKMIDTDNSGTITFEELKAGLKRVGSELMESEIKSLMDAADIDNSGTIDYGEFLAATLHMNKMEREENLVAAFSYFDKDGSGYITIDELQSACTEFGLCDTPLDDMIKEIDLDNDGKIDFSEFTAMMRKGDGVGRSRTMMKNLNFNIADAFGVDGQKSDD